MLSSHWPIRLLICISATFFLPGNSVCVAQGIGNLLAGSKPQSAAAPDKADPLKRDTPRAAIYNFLQACHAGKTELASQYLDLRRIRADQRAAQGPELAR